MFASLGVNFNECLIICFFMEIMLIKKVGTNWQFDNILVYWEMMMMMKMGTNWKSLVQNEAWIKCGCSYGYQIILFFGLKMYQLYC